MLSALPVILLSSMVCCFGQDEGPVALYRFSAGGPALTADSSGNGHDGTIAGGASFASGDFGGALQLNGRDSYVDCGAAEGLDIGSRGTICAWCRPETLQGGLVNWSTGGNWADERLVLAINTWAGAKQMLGCISNGRSAQRLRLDNPEAGRWTHYALTFDGAVATTYQDGVPLQAVRQSVVPDVAGVPLWIGRCQGLGAEFFHGLIDEVGIWNRALSAQEVLSLYKAEAAARGKDTGLFTRPRVTAQAYPGPGCVLVHADSRRMQPLPAGARLVVGLRAKGTEEPAGVQIVEPIPLTGDAEATFDVQTQPAGAYEVVALVEQENGTGVGEPGVVEVDWPGQPREFRDVRVLNNMVWELLNLQGDGAGPGEHAFSMPRARWALVRTVAEVPMGGSLTVTVDDEASPALVHEPAGVSTLEAFRRLPAGAHRLTVRAEAGARLKSLLVRSVPMLQHAFYGADPHIHPHGPYDWEFIGKYIAPHVNTMVGSPGPELEDWKRQGKQWIAIIGLPKLTDEEGEAAVEEAYRHWSSSPGLQNPLMDGIIVDEFGGGDGPVYDIYRQAVERIYANPGFAGKAYYPYGGTFYGDDRSSRFAQAAIDGGGLIAWERYLIEQPTEEAAADEIRRRITDEMFRWEQRFPEAASKMLMVLGYMSQPTESLNVDPAANYKVYMDMQFRALATHPTLFGLGGVQEYHSSYCDEENVRWAARLYRHYCLEGAKEPLTDDPYRLSHLRNPDFADGTAGWSVQPAQEGSIRTGRFDGYSWLQGRYPLTAQGDTFLVMKRNSRGPNVISQEIVDLQPGRLYSLKTITADYQDLVGEVSRKDTHAVSIAIDNVEPQQDSKDGFQFIFPNCYAHVLGKFGSQYPYYMNYHWRVFRATGTTARLTITEWASDNAPGGPEGQELMVNFIELQPYLER